MEAQGAWENGRRKTLIHAPAKPRACENPQTTSWRTLARATKNLGFRVSLGKQRAYGPGGRGRRAAHDCDIPPQNHPQLKSFRV